ncbi:hypothetical protein SBDP1_1460001 [Syntrophobacter sp. SbD1]|nr:hypothetical protein SBDP1_1460001 [Syntrophobacter sp. SbD1]
MGLLSSSARDALLAKNLEPPLLINRVATFGQYDDVDILIGEVIQIRFRVFNFQRAHEQ